jgi:hypothetical protein
MEIDQEAHDKLVKLLDFVGKKANRVLCRTVNATLMNCRTQTTKKIGAHINLKARVIKEHFWITRAKVSSLKSGIEISGKRIPLHRSTGANYGAKVAAEGGVSFQVRYDKGRETFKHGFIATMKSGHVGVFMRVNPGMRKIRQVYGPSIPKALETGGRLEDILVFSKDRILENARQQVNRILAMQDEEIITAEDLENL